MRVDDGFNLGAILEQGEAPRRTREKVGIMVTWMEADRLGLRQIGCRALFTFSLLLFIFELAPVDLFCAPARQARPCSP